MRLTRQRVRSLGAAGRVQATLVQLPAVETVPPEFVGGANLIGEAERVDPALLFGAPATVPGELDGPRLSAALDCHGANEVGAPGSSIDAKAFDDPFGVGVQKLVDEADHLDARDVPHEGDRGRIGARGECDDVGLEACCGAGARQDLSVDWHGRNISAGSAGLGHRRFSGKTKLTASSARRREGLVSQ